MQPVTLGVLCSAGAAVAIVAAAFTHGRWYILVPLVAVAVAASAFLVRRLNRLLKSSAQRIEKSALTARRFQNISKYFESILQDSTDIIFSIDTDGYIMKFNNGSELHFGYTQEEIVGKPLSSLFVNEEDERRLVTTVLLKGKTANREVPMKTKDGRVILLNMSMSEMKPSAEIIGLVVTAKDITEKKKLELELLKKNEMLNKLAITDSLTGLYNSRHFFDQLRRELSRYNRNPGRELAVMLIDIDRFKDLNDTEGHQRGDEVLRTLGQIIQMCIRRNVDSGYRYGGDEFVVVLPDTDMKNARVVAERIQKQYNSHHYGNTSLSIGITQARVDEDSKLLLNRADEAMYQSKKGGRDRVSLK
jgi:diguanylate cyclase (GGDEF)-like protein/PAS domain S-box-containing protein